jgi:hypothetical protein
MAPLVRVAPFKEGRETGGYAFAAPLVYQAEKPPSIVRLAPVINPASELAR